MISDRERQTLRLVEAFTNCVVLMPTAAQVQRLEREVERLRAENEALRAQRDAPRTG